MSILNFLQVAEDLELAGLIWAPSIGDEIADRVNRERVSVLIDPQGLTPTELRSTFLWLPTLEQMVIQLEARQTILYHAGLDLSETALHYTTVIQSPLGQFETKAGSLRESVGIALRSLLLADQRGTLH